MKRSGASSLLRNRAIPVVTLWVAALLSTAALAQGAASDGLVSNSVWGISFSAPGYQIWSEHPLRGQANLVEAGQWEEAGCGVNLSLFAILVQPGTTAERCRSGFAGNPEPLLAEGTVSELVTNDGPVAWSRFVRTLVEGISQNQLYAYYVRDESCFELHVSAIACSSFTEIVSPIVDSLAFEARPWVNVETVGVGASVQLEPSHWRVHLVLANEYLHNPKLSNPTRARMYYENALELGAGDLGFDDTWTIYEGIGLAWLNEDNGDAAIDPLERAVELARSSAAELELGESLYNLACAMSLSGDIEGACTAAGELMDGLGKKERRSQLKEMRQDPQLGALRQAGCIEGL